MNDVSAGAEHQGLVVKELAEQTLSRVSLSDLRLEVNKSIPIHYHVQTEEVFYVLAGEGEIILLSERIQVRAGSVVSVPRLVTHQITNTGRSTLHLLSVCSPPFSPDDTYFVSR